MSGEYRLAVELDSTKYVDTESAEPVEPSPPILEQTLREARRKELTKRIEQQIVADGPAQGRSVNGIIANAERIEACVATLTLFDDSGQLDKGKVVGRAYDILTTQEGSNAYGVMRATRAKKIGDEVPLNPVLL